MSKKLLREEFKRIRARISPHKREQSSISLHTTLLLALQEFDTVLSFVSFGDEIDTARLNQALAVSNRLALPKVVGENLEIYRITDLKTQLTQASFPFKEPEPSLSNQVNLENIQVVLVPALAFDNVQHRLGYGRGMYDRLLKKMPHAYTIGIGFKEQLTDALPTEQTDHALKELALF